MKPLNLFTSVLLVVFALPRQDTAAKITEDELRRVILDASAECERPDQIQISHLEYFDFTGDGQSEAVVVASTCMTGTAGPDIHAVYTRDSAGKVVELPFHHAEGDPFFNRNGWKIPVLGNANYGLTLENGAVVARWR